MKNAAIACIILFACFFLLSGSGFAQLQDLRFEKYTELNGLSENNTSAILQDSRGFIWIGSSQGLNRYDGRFIKKYSLLGDKGLTDLTIQCLAEDSDGNIWIGTQNGLNKFNPLTEIITQYYMGTGPGTIPYKWCNELYVDKASNLWLSTEKGLAFYNKNSDNFENYPIEVFGNDPGINKFISKIFEDNKGRFWLTTSFGIKLFDRKTKQAKSYFCFDSAHKNSRLFPVMSITQDASGQIWAGTWMGGLLKYSEEKNEFTRIDAKGIDLNKLVISDLTTVRFHSDDYLLLATDDGLVILNTMGTPQGTSALTDDVLQNFCMDKQGNLWITGAQGFYKLNNNSMAFRWVHLSGTNTKSLVFHIVPDIKDPENLFYLTTLNGWWKYNNKSRQISQHILPTDQKHLLTCINNWYSEKGGYWFTSLKGFGFYDLQHNILRDFSYLTIGKSNSSATGTVVSSLSHPLWISLHRSGILVFDPETRKERILFNTKNNPDNLLGNSINDLITGRDGRVYCTANNKLYVVSGENYSYKTISPPQSPGKVDGAKLSPDKLFFTSGNQLFVSSALHIYAYSNEKLTTVFPVSGYPNFSIEKIYCTEKGVVWVITSKGVFKTDTTFRQWININDRLGWAENEYISEIYVCKSGEVLLAANGKIGVLNDSMLQKSSTPHPVIISKIKYGSAEVFVIPKQNSGIDLSYKESIEIELASVNYHYEKEVRILYQLQGWDQQWKELADQRSIRYEQLPPGTYKFSARQVNAEGVSSSITTFRMTIEPPFYRTWWFISILIILFIAGFSAISRYRMKKALELERLRTRIAADLHDDIGATLSAISIYSETLKGQITDKQPHIINILNKMGESSREMVTGMSDIVWAINPDNDHAEKLIYRMQNYAADICPAKNILLHFQSSEKLNTIKLPLEHRKNIYLIFKEAMNNAVKYARANNIWVTLLTDGKTITLSIRDDGTGFNEATIRKGNGLKNIRSRAAMLNAELLFTSLLGEGTSLSLKWNR